MNILVILAHPRPGSLNHAIAGTVCDTVRRNGHRTVFHDLSAEQFDPCLPAGEMPEDGQSLLSSSSTAANCRMPTAS